MGYVRGTTRIYEHCTFEWVERQIDGQRYARVEAHHCPRCVAELSRTARVDLGFPLEWPAGTGPPPEAEPRRSHVVLAEDDDDLRALLAAALREAGFSVREARNGKEALSALLEVRDPCLLVLDLAMPVLNGWEVLRVLGLYERFAGVPVIVISGEPIRAPLERCDALLEKPVSPGALLAVIERHATRGRERRADELR